MKTMAHAFGQLQFKGIEIRAPLIKHSADRTEIGIDRVEGAPVWIKRPDITSRRLGGNDQVGLVNAERLMYAARSHVSSHGRQAGSKLVLHIEVPLRHIVALRIRIGVSSS